MANEKQKEFRILVALIAISATIKAWMLATKCAALRDQVGFIRIAEAFLKGRYDEFFGNPQHPLFSMLLAISYKIFGNWEIAGELLSSFFSILILVLLFTMIKREFDLRLAAVTCVLFIFSSALNSSAVSGITEMTYVFFVLAGVSFIWEGIAKRNAVAMVIGGASAGLAYLTRPEGIGILMVALPAIFVAGWKTSAKALAGKIGRSAILLAAFFIIAFPYLLVIRLNTGHWALTLKKKAIEFVSLTRISEEPGHRSKNLERKGETGEARKVKKTATRSRIHKLFKQSVFAAELFFKRFPPAVSYFYFPFLLIGIIYRKTYPRKRFEYFAGGLGLLYAGVLFLLAMSASYLERRQCLAAAVLFLPFCGAGVIEAGALMSKAVKRVCGKNISERSAVIGILIVICAANVIDFAEPSGRDKLAYKEVGLWIKENLPAHPAALSTEMPRTEFYAEGKFDIIRKTTYEELLREAQRAGARYIVAKRDTLLRRCPDFFERIGGDELTAIYGTFEDEKDPQSEIIVYEIKAHAKN